MPRPTTSAGKPNPTTELRAALDDLIQRLEGDKKRGGVQTLAFKLELSPNIIHYWRRTDDTKPARKRLIPKEDQAFRLAKVSLECSPAPDRAHEEQEYIRWYKLCEKWTGTPQELAALRTKMDENDNSMLVDAERLFKTLVDELVNTGLPVEDAGAGIAAYFGQASFRSFLKAWKEKRAPRHLSIFWKADSKALPVVAPESAQLALHKEFADFLTPVSASGDEPCLTRRSSSIDVFVSGQSRAAKIDLRDYITRNYCPAPAGQPAIRFFEPTSAGWEELNIEHISDAWVFYGEEVSAELDFMVLVGEANDEVLNTLSKEVASKKFSNPFQFASQLIRLDGRAAAEFLKKRLIKVNSGGVFPNPKLWTPVTECGNEYWVLRPVTQPQTN